jgi:hypothetical protein
VKTGARRSPAGEWNAADTAMPDVQASAGARSAHTPLVHLLNRSSEPLAACFDARDYRAAVPSQSAAMRDER